MGSAGSGGYTGEPYQSAAPSAACGYVSGNPGLLGFEAEGTAGGCMIFTGCDFSTEAGPCTGMPGICPEVFTAILATWGGGAGIFTGFRAYGSGGGARLVTETEMLERGKIGRRGGVERDARPGVADRYVHFLERGLWHIRYGQLRGRVDYGRHGRPGPGNDGTGAAARVLR